MSHRLLSRAGALVAASGLVLSLGASPSDAARGAEPAAGWLVGQLDNGLIHNDQYDFDDYGLTADVALALDEIGGRVPAETRVSRALARRIDSYTTGADFGSDDRYAGATAKALVVAQASGANPRSFGGADLVARLNGLTLNQGAVEGRIRDRGASDFANTIGQAFAARGLTRAGSPEGPAAVSFLLKQQCKGGFFRLGFAAQDAARQRCSAARNAQRQPSTDATALALVNLQAITRRGPAVRRAITRAATWLVRTQRDNGSFGSDAKIKSSNANSTGLAAWALAGAERCPAAVEAASWVQRLQKPNGAIAYDLAGFAAGKDGIGRAEQDQWRRATAQAGPALLNTSLAACRG